jgi:hypothetical protein
MNTKSVNTLNTSNIQNSELHNAPVSLQNHYNLHPNIKSQEHRLSAHHMQDNRLSAHHMQEHRLPAHHMQEHRLPAHHMQEHRLPMADHMQDNRFPMADHMQDNRFPMADHMQDNRLPMADHHMQDNRFPMADHMQDNRFSMADHMQDNRLPMAAHHMQEHRLPAHHMQKRILPMSAHHMQEHILPVRDPSAVHHNDTTHEQDSLCINDVCFNRSNHGTKGAFGDTILDSTDRDSSYSGFNFGLSTKLQYDTDFLEDDISQSTAPLLSVLDSNRVKNNSQCLSTFGPRAGHNGYGDNIPIKDPGLTPAQELVDIDSIMSNRNVKQSRAKNGNVNPINVFDFKTYDCKECDKFLDPLDTIETYPKQLYREISINRFYDPNINPQINIFYDWAVNTQLEAKDNYENPYPYFISDASTVQGSPITGQVAVYNNRTNSFLTDANGGSIPYMHSNNQ